MRKRYTRNINGIYFVFLALFGRNGGLFGNNGSGVADASLAQQMQDNHNSDLLMSAIKGNNDAAQSIASNLNVGVDSINAAINSFRNSNDLGFSGLQSSLQSCCCQNQKETMKMGYENQLSNLAQTNTIAGRIDQLANGVQTGFAQVGYATQAQTNEIVNASNANTQRILDKMCSNETQNLRDKLWQLSQDAQTTSIVSQLKTTTTA